MNRGHRIQASSLIESVLALALLAGVLSFSVGLHFRVLTADRSSDRLLAWTLSECLLAVPPSTDATTVVQEMNGLIGTLTLSPYATGLREALIIVQRDERDILVRRSILPWP